MNRNLKCATQSLILYLNQSNEKILSVLFILAAFYSNAQTIIPLYNGAAPGSENWNWDETQIKLT
jgi:hypothetical protein